ncbi:hypothetical protein ACFHW2_43025 [Actinomadura sp. LOL_016]|uniref:hypothetical protein n=1 Tax=unclassified Actinomadura TaxID=2626254 RepID=UPI003A8034D8
MSRPGRPRVPSELSAYLEQCEHVARAEADRLQAAITELTEQLDHTRQHCDRLAPTRRTLQEITDPEPGEPAGRIHTLPPAYRDILALFTRTDGALRAKDLCKTLETGTEPRHVEAMRAKLKRLVGRDVLTNPSPDCSPSIQTSPNKTPSQGSLGRLQSRYLAWSRSVVPVRWGCRRPAAGARR